MMQYQLIQNIIISGHYVDHSLNPFLLYHLRALCGSLTESFPPVGTFLGPLLVERLIAAYGWRGSMLISGGFILNLSAAGLLYRPYDENVPSCRKKRPTVNG